MPDAEPLDRPHLFSFAQALFPGAMIGMIHEAEEIIHIEVDGRRYTFEISSDDDAYHFVDGDSGFTIPLLEIG